MTLLEAVKLELDMSCAQADVRLRAQGEVCAEPPPDRTQIVGIGVAIYTAAPCGQAAVAAAASPTGAEAVRYRVAHIARMMRLEKRVVRVEVQGDSRGSTQSSACVMPLGPTTTDAPQFECPLLTSLVRWPP